MRDFHLTLLADRRDVVGHPYAAPWPSVVAALTSSAPRTGDKDGPAVVLGPLDGPRSKANLRHVEALAFDLDTDPRRGITPDDVFSDLQAFAASRFEHVVWTTHSHGVAKPASLRVVVPLSAPIPVSAQPTAYTAVRLALGLRSDDPGARDPARLHYLPARNPHNPGAFRAWHQPGLPVEAPQAPPGAPRSATVGVADPEPASPASARSWAARVPKGDPDKSGLLALSQGAAFARPGGRHAAIVALTWRVASRFPGLGEDGCWELFRPSIDAMAQETPHDPPTEGEVRAAWRGAFEKQQAERVDRAMLGVDKLPDEGASLDQLDYLAQLHGWTVDELHKRWILLGTAGYYVMDPERQAYRGPYLRAEVAQKVIWDTLAPIGALRLAEVQKGRMVYRTPSELAHEYGAHFDAVIVDLTAQRATYDPARKTVREAPCPIRVDPVWHDDVDQWLSVLAGPRKAKLDDWLSVVPDLRRLLCALYLAHAPGSGKTLLAHGLARIWSDGPPSRFVNVVGNHNDTLTRCPLVLADEHVEGVRPGQVTAVLRDQIGATSRSLNRKFMPTSEIHGAVRLVLSANNTAMLNSPEVATAEDIDAIAQRFLFVDVTGAATAYMKSIPESTKQRWLTSAIAEHAVYLMHHHTISQPGQRFAVDGDIAEMHRLLVTGTKWNSLVAEWLCAYLMRPQIVDNTGEGLVVVENGRLLVNDLGVYKNWRAYISARLDPELPRISAALRALSSARVQRTTPDGKRPRFRVIDEEHLFAFADEQGMATPDELRARLQRTAQPGVLTQTPGGGLFGGVIH